MLNKLNWASAGPHQYRTLSIYVYLPTSSDDGGGVWLNQGFIHGRS